MSLIAKPQLAPGCYQMSIFDSLINQCQSCTFKFDCAGLDYTDGTSSVDIKRKVDILIKNIKEEGVDIIGSYKIKINPFKKNDSIEFFISAILIDMKRELNIATFSKWFAKRTKQSPSVVELETLFFIIFLKKNKLVKNVNGSIILNLK